MHGTHATQCDFLLSFAHHGLSRMAMKTQTVDSIHAALVQVGLLPFYASLLIFGDQCFDWLRSGEWSSISGIDVLLFIGLGNRDWLESPERWVGIWKLLHWMPGTMLIATSSVISLSTTVELGDWLRRKTAPPPDSGSDSSSKPMP
jgi:hypothetical protein